MERFIGRKSELEMLNSLYKTDRFQFIVLYGRRRVGKTTLINEFTNNCDCKVISYYATEENSESQLENFSEAIFSAVAPEMAGLNSFGSYEKALTYIGSAAEKERIILVIDEYTNLVKNYPEFSSLLQKAVDKIYKKTKLYIIVSGSAVSMMKEEFEEKSPLYERPTRIHQLKTFDYLTSAEFVPSFSDEDKAKVYCLTNGIAEYLAQFDDKQTLEENIINLFYKRTGYFHRDYSLIIANQTHAEIIKAIVNGKTKQNEIATALGQRPNNVSYHLNTLMQLGYIEKRLSGKNPYYVVQDTFLMFWFKCVIDGLNLINADKGDIFFEKKGKSEFENLMGTCFEKICKEFLYKKLGSDLVPEFFDELDEKQFSSVEYDENGKKTVRQYEIDIVGKNGKDNVLAAECKFRNEKVDQKALDTFVEKVNHLEGNKIGLYFFSKAGYQENIDRKNVKLVEIGDIYF